MRLNKYLFNTRGSLRSQVALILSVIVTLWSAFSIDAIYLFALPRLSTRGVLRGILGEFSNSHISLSFLLIWN